MITPNEASYDDLSQEKSSENVTNDEEKILGNERSKRSSAFIVPSKNMKEFTQKTSVIDMGGQDKNHKWFTSLVAEIMLSSALSTYVQN